MKAVSNSTIHAGRKTAPKFLTVLLAASSFIALAWLSGTAVRSRAASFTAGEPEPRGQRLSDRGANELRTILNVVKLAAFGDQRLTSFADEAQELYNSTDHSLLWVENRRPTAQAREILSRLQHAEEKGLDPEDYDGRFGGFRFAPPEIPAHPSESDLIRFDVVLTLGTVRYLSNLHCGRANPESPVFHERRRRPGLPPRDAAVRERDQVRGFSSALERAFGNTAR
jgi:murein L,D-transpeptidase YcbB/YkuD